MFFPKAQEPGEIFSQYQVSMPDMLVDLNDAEQVFNVLILAIFRLLWNRKEIPKDTFRNRLDRMRYEFYTDRKTLESLIIHTTLDAGRIGTRNRKQRTADQSALPHEVISELASEITASYFGLWEKLSTEMAELFANVLEVCCKLLPDRPIHRYRLGAFLCYTKNYEEALQWFSVPAKLREQRSRRQLYVAAAYLEAELIGFQRRDGDERRKTLCRLCAMTANLLNSSGSARSELQRMASRVLQREELAVISADETEILEFCFQKLLLGASDPVAIPPTQAAQIAK